MKKLILILFVFNCSSVVYETKTSEFKNEIENLKRIQIQISKNKLLLNERNMLLEIAKQELSHRTNFIHYAKPNPKIESILFLEPEYEKKGELLQVSLVGYLIQKSDFTYRFKAKLKKTFSSTEENSLVATYKEKYGDSVSKIVIPFFEITKEFIEELGSPKKLTEAEEFEKIEEDSN
jgi:probable lipoprotein (TIGR04455 family)